MKKKTDYHYLMVIIAGCGMIGVTLGVAGNLAGLFFNDIAREFNVGRGTVALTATIYNFAQAVVGMLAPNIVRRIGFRLMALIGSVVIIGTTVLISMVHSITPMLLLNVLRGFAAGCIGMVIVNITINYWFHKNNSLITSIAMSFSGVIGALLSPFLSGYIAANGWRSGYLLISGIMALLLLPAVLFPISLRPENLNLKPYGEGERGSAVSSEEKAGAISPVLFSMILVYTLAAPCATSISQHYTGISDSYGLASLGALMVSATMITNTVGKLLFGAVSDKLGGRITTSSYVVAVIGALILLTTSRSSGLLMASAALIGLSYSLGTVATSSMVREIFGAANYSRIYPKLSFSITASSSVFTTLIGSVYDLTGSYRIILLAMAVFYAIALTAIQLLYKKKSAH